MKVLITGASGSIGRRLVKKLSEYGKYDIKELVRAEIIIENTETGIEGINGDLGQVDSLVRASTDVDTIIHLAGITHTHTTSLYYQINLLGTKNLIQAAEQTGVRQFIFLSTRTASYDGGGYARSKILAEQSLIRSNLNWVIIRPAEVYGTDSENGIQKIINSVNTRRILPIVGNGRFTLAPVFVDDLVDGIASTIGNHQAVGKIFVLQGPREYTFVEMVGVLEDQLRRKTLKIFLPVLIVKIFVYFLYLLRSKSIYRDQIPRLLCTKSEGDYSFEYLGIRPRRLEDAIKINFHS